MEEEVLVKVENLSKKFCKDLRTSLWYGLKDLMGNLFGRENSEELRPKEFWAVRDVSFELKRGECLGLIGHNGAGKSTLLKILNGLINPDAGKVTIKGRVGALIELGAGFNTILTGRENIYNNGAILGFSKKEIDAKLSDIIAFSELEEFIDMPVQHYSSGMKVRLGFAVAAQMEPDVLLIDEVLAVGDISFTMKSFNAIGKLMSNTAVVFVSHSMPFISRICDSVILLEKGSVVHYTHNAGQGIQSYLQKQKLEGSLNFREDLIKLNFVKIYSSNKNEKGFVNYGEKLCFKLNVDSTKNFKEVRVAILIYNMEQINVALFETNIIQINKGQNQTFEFDFGNSYLSISKYFITVRFDSYTNNKVETLSNFVSYKSFQVIGNERLVFAPFYKKEQNDI